MSSYLSIYIVPKRKSKEEKKYILLTSYCRSSEVYQYFNENIHPAYNSGEENKYTTITKEDIALVLKDFNNDISKYERRLNEYEKYAKDNPEYIDDIINLKEEISNLKYWRDKTSFIEDMVCDVQMYKVIEEVCCNID